MKSATLGQKVVKGAAWVLMERLSVQAVAFLVSMVLARLLTPNDYGTVALTSIFFAVTEVLIDGGFGTALIQKRDADELDFNSVFYLSASLSLLAVAVLWLSASWIADFYETPALVPIVRVSSLSLIFSAMSSIQNAELTRKMLFNLSFRISLISCAVSAVCGIGLALLGCGVWSLVISSLLANAVAAIVRWFIIAWRPQLMFSWSRLRPLFSYGWKMAASALLNSFFSNLNGLLIGKFYSKAELAYVNKGQSLPNLLMNQVDGTLGRVSFPALVQIKDDPEKLREVMRRMIQCSTFLVFPLMMGLAVCARSLLQLLYGSQWTPAAPFMMMACFSFALFPFHTINLRGIMVLGRSDVFLKLEIIKKMASLLMILIAFRYGVFAFMAASAFALGPFGVIVNAWPNRRLLNYTIGMQVRDVFPAAVICLLMGGAVLGVDWYIHMLGWGFETTHSLYSLVCLLLGQFIVGVSVFFSFAWAFKLRPMQEYVNIVKSYCARRRNS